jgi:hypothetical protein
MYSFALARSVEYFRIPRDVLTICVGKSTYALCISAVCGAPWSNGQPPPAQASWRTRASSWGCCGAAAGAANSSAAAPLREYKRKIFRTIPPSIQHTHTIYVCAYYLHIRAICATIIPGRIHASRRYFRSGCQRPGRKPDHLQAQ